MIDSFSGITGPLDNFDGATYLQVTTTYKFPHYDPNLFASFCSKKTNDYNTATL